MDKSIVALVPCASYDQDAVNEAVQQGVTLLGGIQQFVAPEEKILLKPNLLGKALPQMAVTTHPAVFSAVAKLLREAGYEHVSYGDSPGNPTAAPIKAAEASGIKQAAESWNIPIANFQGGETAVYHTVHGSYSFNLCHGVLEADAIINLCKMKTHALERITGAVKNIYGCIWGANKAAGHARYPSAESFAEMVSHLLAFVKPRLHIMDGITAMEGNGPTSGTPIHMGVLLFSADPVALDAVFANLIHLNPESVPTCVAAARIGQGTYEAGNIIIRTPDGDRSMQEIVEAFGNPDYDVFRGKLKKNLIAKFVPLLPCLQDRPVVDNKKCVACGICHEACPVESKAVHSGNGQKATYDYRKCIRCYCCQEMCPAKAITVHHSLYNRLIGK